ncbi:Predicted lipid-binding transport protein, Tim44 family [Nitrosomonas cryotolerans]|uniref:Predicted lipid-binding transport protein, Tim44 family n=1 Tax=Nitrosomonas cryotolerans ATCC 49181 TaxID=1131553 RepID=A0A1N6H2V8_9PROT|nr:TIM44-like domain-containing protein [Nitrosomonas cryotolerans]SFP72628.1 Predicted lipid-binding transport protein, Tim44 family [Nitrosomonas cryotolerans]SIO14032.1 Predicted lipid-binding transport protein, Tim44 family [Nitrosomonas cryotolerans ATCC 49181]
MKKIFTLLTLVMFSSGMTAFDVEAKRMGGGKNIGKQRESVNQQATANPKQAPAATPAATPPASGLSKWAGPLAGLAAGGLLAALFMGGAFEGMNMMDIVILVVLIAAIFFIIRMMRKPHKESPTRPMQFSGLNTNTDPSNSGIMPPPPSSASVTTPTKESLTHTHHSGNIPADFQVEPFLRQAKISFIRLQAAHDTGDTNDIREYTTPEMFAEISMQINERTHKVQKTEIISIDADLLDIETTDELAVASVRFTGQIRETPDALPETFDEIWHVQKDLKDNTATWLLTGIQQTT